MVLSLAGWVNSGIVHLTLRDLIDLESAYKGLIGDIDTAIWQILLLQEQKDAENGS